MSSPWKKILEKEVRFYRNLNATGKNRFERSILRFLERVQITGIGIEIDDTDRLLVASSAVIPLFGFPGWEYRNLNEVLLYDRSFNPDLESGHQDENALGMVGTGAMNRMMILSKPALVQGFRNNHSKQNVGIHEFVHLLDKADGETDGIPEIFFEEPYVIPWIKLVQEEINKIKDADSDINPYGATNEAEFLSVVSEYFFNQPALFKKKHPKLYQTLSKIFNQPLETD
ncbi:MAG: zinc-dependent peptidase [Saprospiraceae bacterium]|nr:zinc-dependent peptidase [Saprospiraceae bacterium]